MRCIRAMMFGMIIGTMATIISLSKMDRRTKKKVFKAGKKADDILMQRCECMKNMMM